MAWLVAPLRWISELIDEEGVDRVVEPARDVLAQTTNAEIAWEEPEPGNQLVDIEDDLALAQRVEQHRYRTDFHRVRTEPDQMAREPLQFRDEHARIDGHADGGPLGDEGRTGGRLEPCEPIEESPGEALAWA